jgi:hypothetical protein
MRHQGINAVVVPSTCKAWRHIKRGPKILSEQLCDQPWIVCAHVWSIAMQDPSLGKRIIRIIGTIPAVNYMKLPTDKSIHMPGRFCYIQVRAKHTQNQLQRSIRQRQLLKSSLFTCFGSKQLLMSKVAPCSLLGIMQQGTQTLDKLWAHL